MIAIWVGLLWFVFAGLQAPAAGGAVVTPRLHHVRCGVDREWAEFPERAEGADLTLAFRAKTNEREQTLRLRHRDLKQLWLVSLNGKEIARLPPNEADTITYWPVPTGTLLEGVNTLRVHCNSRTADDVLVGHVTLIDRPRGEVLSDATIDVSVREEASGRAIPSRITVSDRHGTLVSLGNESDRQHAVRPGVIYTAGGAARLQLPAGRYIVHAGRGFEFSVASTEVVLSRGDRLARTLTIRREVDTAGWAAMDTHVHTGTFARHGDASIEERMLTIAGEGIELPVSTEHNMRVDFDARAKALGVREHFTPIIGSEVTTPSLGHFNVFPLAADGAPIDHGAPDWKRLGQSVADAAAQPAIVLNHARDVHGGFRPFGTARHIGIAGEDLDGWALPANAMEVVNSGAVMSDALSLSRDWMGLLNRGAILAPVGSSDSHDVSRYILGQGRTYVRCDDRDPGRLEPSRVVESLRRGQVMVSFGLLTEIDVDGQGPGELVDPRGDLAIRIRVKGPRWTRATRIALFVNGTEVREVAHEAAGGGAIPRGGAAGVKWEGVWRVPRPSHDIHLVAIATGPGVVAPYWPTAKPYQPTSIAFTPYVIGLSGAVFVDADRSGRFESAFEYARREVSATSDVRQLTARLAAYDAAVATQAASLVRARTPDRFEQTIRTMAAAAPAHVAKGLMAYLDAWKDSVAAGDVNPKEPAGPAASHRRRGW